MGRLEEALRAVGDVYFGYLKLDGEGGVSTLVSANNYADLLLLLECFEEARSLMHRLVPVARRVLGNTHDYTLSMRKIYAEALYRNPGATLDDLREAVETIEEIERTMRRVLGSAHPRVRMIEESLESARAKLHVRETLSTSA